MVTKIITNENGEPLFKEVTPDEGKALFCHGMEDMEGVREIVIPLSWDFETMFFEKSIN